MTEAEDRTTAYEDGWVAHYKGHSCDLCPYSEHLQARSHVQWLSGRCDRFSAIKNGHDYEKLDGELGL